MKKLLSNIYFGIFSLVIISLLAIILTIDVFDAIFYTSSYNFNVANPSFSRRTLLNYLITTIPENLVLYFLIYKGIVGIKYSFKKNIMVLNIAFIIIILMLSIGLFLWSKTGFDH